MLEAIVNPYQCITPVEVQHEILAGVAAMPDLADVLTAQWLEPVELSEVHELAAFARYKTQLGGGSKEEHWRGRRIGMGGGSRGRGDHRRACR